MADVFVNTINCCGALFKEGKMVTLQACLSNLTNS